MAVNSSQEGQNAYGVAVSLSPDQSEAELSLRLLEDPEICKMDAQVTSQNHVKLEMENIDAYFPCIVDIDVDKDKLETVKTNDEVVENLKNVDPITRTLQRQVSVKVMGKFTQLLMSYSLIPPKFISRDKSAADRVHDVHNNNYNRLRKYKRSASFNSRSVVLLFSVLSSMGTLILIYLTLRVRQLTDSSLHV